MARTGLDSNRNFDGVTDRVVINPDGVARAGNDLAGLTNSDGAIVGYLAYDPSARYVAPVARGDTNGSRDALPPRGINNFDGSVR